MFLPVFMGSLKKVGVFFFFSLALKNVFWIFGVF